MAPKRSARFKAAIEAYDDDRLDDAMRSMEQCALEGDPAACSMLARWCREKIGEPNAAGCSARWLRQLRQLAEAGNAEAQWDLGQHHRFGELMPRDVARANYWLLRAAEGGHPEAQHHLAWYLESGDYDHSRDQAEADRWYRRAFAQGHPETLYLYAIRRFHNGRPTDEAIALLKRAAADGLIVARNVLRTHTH